MDWIISAMLFLSGKFVPSHFVFQNCGNIFHPKKDFFGVLVIQIRSETISSRHTLLVAIYLFLI